MLMAIERRMSQSSRHTVKFRNNPSPSTTCGKAVILIQLFRIGTAHSVELRDTLESESWNQESIE